MTKDGDLEPPNGGKQQTTTVVFDIDGDGVNDFVIGERTQAPAVVWYRRHKSGWSRHVLEPAALRIEAGASSNFADGDLSLIAGRHAGSNEVWSWEYPHPGGNVTKPWNRRAIKASHATKLMFADVESDGLYDVLEKPYNYGVPGLNIWLRSAEAMMRR